MTDLPDLSKKTQRELEMALRLSLELPRKIRSAGYIEALRRELARRERAVQRPATDNVTILDAG